MSCPSSFGVDLYWIPLGARGHVVRSSGKIFEALAAGLERRERCDLSHSVLAVRVPEGRFVLEMAPALAEDGARRGVVAEGAVGSRWARRLRIFRYEVRMWRDGTTAYEEAVAGPQRLTDDAVLAGRVLDLVPLVPTPVWGRDELGAGEMWTCNSLTSWALAGSGLHGTSVRPPAGGRAPGWTAGLEVARRARAVRRRDRPPREPDSSLALASGSG